MSRMVYNDTVTVFNREVRQFTVFGGQFIDRGVLFKVNMNLFLVHPIESMYANVIIFKTISLFLSY